MPPLPKPKGIKEEYMSEEETKAAEPAEEVKTSESEGTKEAPGFFEKTLTKKQLRKKYLKYIEQPDDRDFILSCYNADEDNLEIRNNLTGQDVKRLNLLKKAIKGNKKTAVKLIPLAAAAAVIAALVLFFTFLMNPILQRAMEKGLETVFEARVNAERFRISLIKFEIGMNSLTIADRDEPMKNLFQFSAMRIKLKPQAVLRGKVYIEEIRADHIRFGTPRTVSGALPGITPRQKAAKEEPLIPPLVDLANFDPMALLNQEYDKLQTPKLYDSAIAAYESSFSKWKNEQESAKARLAELQAKAEPLLKINMNDYKTLDANTIEQIRKTIADVNALVSSVQAVQGDVNRIVSGVQGDINTAISLEQSAKNAITTDFNHLRSYIDLGSGAAMDVLEPVVRSILTDTAETYIDYGYRALEVLQKVKEMQAKLPKSAEKPPKKEVFRGRDVAFPTRQYPRFFLGILATDVLTPKAWQWDFDLRGVSSDPDLSGTPVSLALSLAETDSYRRSAGFKGTADFRSNAVERFNAEVSGGGFPVNISAGLQKIGIGGFSGGASFRVNAAGRTDGGFSAGGAVSLVQAKLTNPANTFAQAADEAIRQVGSVDLGMQYEHIVSGRDRFSLTTNFADILKQALAGIVSRYRKQAEDALEKALRSRIEQYIDGRFVGKEELDTVFRLVRGDKTAVDDLKGILDKKKNELETKIKGAAGQAVEEVKEQVQQQGQQAIQDILHGQTPSVPTLPIPTIPGLPKR